MVTIYNPNCKLSSVKTHDEYLYKKIFSHFLTYRRTDHMFKSVEKDCVTCSTAVKSVIEELEKALGRNPSREDIIRIESAKKMLSLNGLINLYLVDKDLFDQIEPLKPQE
jgi:hypothetical protein